MSPKERGRAPCCRRFTPRGKPDPSHVDGFHVPPHRPLVKGCKGTCDRWNVDNRKQRCMGQPNRPREGATHEIGNKTTPETKDAEDWAVEHPASFQGGRMHPGLATSRNHTGVQKDGASDARAEKDNLS